MNPKLLFRDILRGYSILTLRKPAIYLKHISHLELCELEETYEREKQRALENGFPLTREREKELKDSNSWPKEKAQKLKDELFMLETFQTNIRKTPKISDIKQIKQEIKKTELAIKLLKIEKSNLMGKTAEWFADKKMNEEFLFTAAFKDDSLTSNYFSREEFEEIDETQLNILSIACRDCFDAFGQYNLQKIALSGFFREYFSLADDDPVKFYGKHILGLSYNQSRLFIHGIEMTHILKDIGNKLPREYLEDPDMLLDYYNVNKNADELKSKSQDGSWNPVGLKPEDLKALGMDKQMTNVSNMVKKHGGNMNMEQMLNEGLLG